MKRTAFPIVLIISTLMLASCAHMPKLFWKESEGSGTQQVNAIGADAERGGQCAPVTGAAGRNEWAGRSA